MNWECRNAMRCTTYGCTAKVEIEALREKVAAMTLERDTLNAALDAKITICGDTSLAAAQARIVELRDALEKTYDVNNLYTQLRIIADAALTTTDNTDALDRRLQEEYLRGFSDGAANYATQAIRSIK